IKLMCRQGIPVQYRSDIWRRLIYAKISDLKQEKGEFYFGHLITRAYDSLVGYYRKQIFIDLLRTMPTNINFSSADAEGIRKLKEVLLAFSFHNPSIGYCQGLNFVASMCLLFLDTEDAFWALVAITEKYFQPTYFDKSLTGANIDQEVFQEMFSQKLPVLYAHVKKFDLEFSTITINWFLALFIEVVPFQTLLRIWDCFLMEGPKVLFRFSLAILQKHQEVLMEQREVLGLLKCLKNCTKLLLDVDGLVKTAFGELKPFPKRHSITTRQLHFEKI
ncbi:hypothetical protein HELRODRAFT_150328, partial [Helobdella robusta]|uniref:Rab-GAP TBC domain-containing protein n=1 Tax=Helobdella robusta TaxID=6412 RepID=T1EKF1_HELRO